MCQACNNHNVTAVGPFLQVMGFSTRREADDFMQSRQKYVLGAVHFVDAPTKQLQYIIQSNTSVGWELHRHIAEIAGLQGSCLVSLGSSF